MFSPLTSSIEAQQTTTALWSIVPVRESDAVAVGVAAPSGHPLIFATLRTNCAPDILFLRQLIPLKVNPFATCMTQIQDANNALKYVLKKKSWLYHEAL